MLEESRTRINDIDIAKTIIAHEAVDCFSGIEQLESIQSNDLVSCTGGNFHGVKEESWPVATDGVPLIPWLQIVCTEMPTLYGAFYNRKMINFYLREDIDTHEIVSAQNNCDFVVREYCLEDELTPLKRPAELKGHPYRKVKWSQEKDFPALSKYYELFDQNVRRSLSQIHEFEFANRFGIKIGGWPTPIQQSQQYPGSCDLQIDITENFTFGDSSIGYLTRMGQHWHLIFEGC